ncbi:MAG: hypothetical protein KAI29_02525, partial [Cyclobacteriaceae bacterium]|nr:hypothetical protein [Cyclobacteriaceae bacterium]
MKRSIALVSYAFVVIAFFIVLSNQTDVKSPKAYKKSAHEIVERKAQIDSHIKKKKLTRGEDRFKFDNPNYFADYHWGIRTRQSEDQPGYLAGATYSELLKAKQNKYYRSRSAARTSELEWIERGPSNVPGRT